MKKRHGQVLILILLIVVVALAVGLSVASRNITNLRTSTQTEHSQRALTAAEGGIEDILSRLSEVAPVGAGVSEEYTVPVGDISANVTVTAKTVYEATIQPGEVGQINLIGATCSSPPCQIEIEWAKKGDLSEKDENGFASIETILVIKNDDGTYRQDRKAFKGDSQASQSNESGTSATTPCSGESGFYERCTPIAWQTGSEILRIRPFWLKATVTVSSGNLTFPVQTYDITSQASTEIGVTRKVQVRRNALPQLPAAFDFVLYSEEDITK